MKKNQVVAFLVGLLFGLGLILSGMTDPGKVQGFLDLAGAWDPSLAFVMGGAILVGLGAFAVARRRSKAWLGGAMQLPTRRDIDRPLVVGSLVFGAGWGLAGFCPGPALVALAAGHWQALLFTLAMLAGMALHDLRAQRRLAPREAD
ncbi:MAG: YeeE/YedE family protein [Pseudacidovorax sp.]|nr:YeeE/YedE family protein [Pseudacidovorax sp.]